MPRTLTVLQFIGSLLRHTAVRAVLWLAVLLWAFDRAIYFVTEGQWFASVGLQSLWWARCRAESELFGASLLVSWIIARLFLGPITQIAPKSGPLRGRLSGFEPARVVALNRAWAIMAVAGLVLSRRFASFWADWLYLRGGSHDDSTYLGFPVTLWTQVLPILSPFLHALWIFSLILWAVVAVTGLLRALPQLAARQSVSPPPLTRTLWCLVAWLLLLRAVLHGLQILELSRGRALQTGDLYVSAPIFALGGAACLLLCFWALRRAVSAPVRRKFPRLGFGIVAACWLPGILNWLTVPERSLLAETDTLKKLRVSSTQKSWRLSFENAAVPTRDVPPDVAWPVWDEKALFQVIKPTEFIKGHLVTWRGSTLHFENGAWHALLTGTSAASTAWTARRDTDDSSQLAVQRLDFSAQSGEILPPRVASQHDYFGYEGSSLFSQDPIGVPITSMLGKLAWAWRLRDLFLLADSADNSHLLVFRGAIERAEMVAPFWKVSGEQQLVFDGSHPYWMLDVCAATSNYPGAMSTGSGNLAGFNTASDGIKMLVDARSGGVSFFSVPRPSHDPLLEDWRAALPGTLKISDEMSLPLRQEWRAAPDMLMAQIGLLDELSGAPGPTQFFGPQLGLDSHGAVVSRAVAVHGQNLQMLESASGATQERTLRHANFNFEARLNVLDDSITDDAKGKLLYASSTEPAIWPAASAPGGFWIGRLYFATAPDGARETVTDAKQTGWRVALTGAAADPALGVGVSLRAAALDYLGATAPTSSEGSGPASAPPAVQALRAHNAAQSALQNGDWKTWAQQSDLEKKLLEQMISSR